MWNEQSRGKTSWGNSNGFLNNGSVVDLIIENGAEIDSNHPFHKHNHKVWIIGQGDGGFRWNDVDAAMKDGGAQYFNLGNPPYRDGFTLYAGAGKFVVVRYEIFFPAVSMLHCHMIHHFAVRSFMLKTTSDISVWKSTNMYVGDRVDSRLSCWRGWKSCHLFHRS